MELAGLLDRRNQFGVVDQGADAGVKMPSPLIAQSPSCFILVHGHVDERQEQQEVMRAAPEDRRCRGRGRWHLWSGRFLQGPMVNLLEWGVWRLPRNESRSLVRMAQLFVWFHFHCP